MATADPWHALAPGVFVMTCASFRLNVGLIVGQDHALLIDTGASLDAGIEIVTLARAVTDLPLEAVNTHSHFDHCFGNGALDPNRIWSHRLCAEHLRWDGEEQQREVTAELRASSRELAQQVAHSRIVQPGRLLDYQVKLDLGSRTVTLFHPGRGHTDNDVVAWVTDERVLFAGDLVEQGAPPSFEDSFPLEWPVSLAALLALGPDRIVPGHGAVVDADFVRRQHDDLQRLAEIAQQGFKNSRRPAEIDAQSAFPGRPAQTAIRRAYDQIAASSTGVWTERQPG